MADRNEDPDSGRALLAFRLGWVTAELLGWLRKGLRPSFRPPRAPDYAPRLSVSEGRPANKGERFWLAARQLVDLAARLDLLPAPPHPPHPIRRLPEEARAWLDGAKAQIMTPAALRALLNTWSLSVWSCLEARDEVLARAFAAGMSLADTYWYLRPPGRTPEPDTRRSHEDWRNLLSVYRLDAERGRLQGLRGVLPPATGGVVRRHLRPWSIGAELYYDRTGRLRRLAWPFRLSHPLSLPRRWRKSHRSPALKPQDEQAIQNALARQAEVWHTLLFGIRPAESYLYPRDRQSVVWLARIGLFLLVFLALGVPAILAILVLSVLLGSAAAGLLNRVQATVAGADLGAWKDLVTLTGGLLTAAGTFVVFFRPLFAWLHQAHQHMRQDLTEFFVARRTLIPWDREIRKRAERAGTSNPALN